MELYLMDSHSEKKFIKRKGSSLINNSFILVCLLLAFNFSAHLVQQLSQDDVRRSIHECLVTLAVKFLNFCIAKSVQYRYVVPLQTLPSFTPLLFWVPLTLSVSTLYS
ncbi:hypothetical protein ABFS82_04G209100 [Erythranthe guttata]